MLELHESTSHALAAQSSRLELNDSAVEHQQIQQQQLQSAIAAALSKHVSKTAFAEFGQTVAAHTASQTHQIEQLAHRGEAVERKMSALEKSTANALANLERERQESIAERATMLTELEHLRTLPKETPVSSESLRKDAERTVASQIDTLRREFSTALIAFGADIRRKVQRDMARSVPATAAPRPSPPPVMVGPA